TDATAHRAEIFHARAEGVVERSVAGQRGRHDGHVPPDVDIGNVGLQTENPVRPDLPVVTHLAATDESVSLETNPRRASTARHIGYVRCSLSGCRDVVFFAECVAGANAEIEPRPVVGR